MTVDTTGARRSTNRRNAKFFAEAGLYVFPSNGKVPLVPRYTKADTAISKDEREAAIEEFELKHGKRPVHVGATNKVAVINDMWREFPDAVPSISCGPSRLVVLDADQKDGGPEKLRALFEEHGGPPVGVAINPTKSGGAHFVFRDVEGKFTNKAGLLKKQYGTDVRGIGGQFVGPGSIREDGATYGNTADRDDFVRAFMTGKLPPLPNYIVELIGSGSGNIEREQPTPIKEREVIKLLEGADLEKHAHAFDSDLGSYDLNGLLADNAAFRQLYDVPGSDCSTNRFLAAQHLMREWPDMPAPALAVFFEQWPGAGEYVGGKPGAGQYDKRQIAREWLKNQGLKKPSNGGAFDEVDEMDDQGAYIANGGSPEGWDAWQQRFDSQRLERLARIERERMRDEVGSASKPRDEDTGKDRKPANGKAPAWVQHVARVPLDLDLDKLPPRPFVYGGELLRGAVALLSAAGGAGKSLLQTSALVDLSCGVDHLGVVIKRPRRCFLYDAEDSLTEIYRRIAAYMRHHKFTEAMMADVRENLLVLSGVDGTIRIADLQNGKVVVNQRQIEALEAVIAQHAAEVIAVNPLRSLHSTSENGNDAMGEVMRELNRIAAVHDLAAWLAQPAGRQHHQEGLIMALAFKQPPEERVIIERKGNGDQRVCKAKQDASNARRWNITLEHPSGSTFSGSFHGDGNTVHVAMVQMMMDREQIYREEAARGHRQTIAARDVNIPVNDVGEARIGSYDQSPQANLIRNLPRS
ncbi:AAA family ATPase [Bradyrhizobium sp. HKCCYLS20291]|uniref:AAA family ATPase n=1 Tax=Bradyrhizobium sp. HKCCYLS20291 TaxID=3420766 RepID=UPI003EBE2525